MSGQIIPLDTKGPIVNSFNFVGHMAPVVTLSAEAVIMGRHVQ